MKTFNLQKILAIATIAGLALLASNVGAQTTTAAPQLSYGVAEIAQLAQAKVGDTTIIAYIKNSNLSYGLDANQIVYLRQQGVSNAVITTMLSQPKPAVATVPAPATSVPLPSSPAPTVVAAASPAPVTTVAPSVTYVQTVPTTTYYYAQPYCYPTYYGGWVPNVSLSFGFGRYYGGHGGYYGGWHGGYGGGWHGHH